MSTRRPRIKASANLALASKRKPKTTTETITDFNEKPKVLESTLRVEHIEDKTKVSTSANLTPISENEQEINLELLSATPSSVPALSTPSEVISVNSSEDAITSEPVAQTPPNSTSETLLEPVPSNSSELVLVKPSEHATVDENVPVLETTDELQTNSRNELSESSVEVAVETTKNFVQRTQDNVIQYESIDSSLSQSLSPEVQQDAPRKTLQSFEDAFKYPLNPDYKRPSAVLPIEDNTASDFEDNILHMDLQKSPCFPMSPTKSRQRIRPTPIFGQRRNSFVGTSPSPHTEDETGAGATRQRSSNSTSSDVSGSFLMRKLAAGNLGRIRTESGCSTVSETRGSSRKNLSDEQRNLSKRDYQMRFNGAVPDKSSLKMFDLIYYNPSTNPMEKKSTSGTIQPTDITDTVPETNPKPQYMADSAMPVPQLKLGSNGEMMIDEMSLEIETTAEVEARKVLANSSLIYHDENSSGEGFYKKCRRTKDWLPDETIKFYRCLQTIGTDFSLMLTLFPNRTRRDLKLKFKKEERCNLNLINKALLYPGTFNIEDLQKQLEEEENMRQVEEAKWKEIKINEAMKKKKQNSSNPSVSSRILTSGDEVYQNENITKAKLSKRAAPRNSNPEKKTKRKRKTKELSSTYESVDNSVLENELTEILDIASDDDLMDSVGKNEDLSEASINLILSELANGTLAFVTSEDLTNPNKTIVNEIYIMCKETKQLSDKPLDLPDDIVDAIRAAITS